MSDARPQLPLFESCESNSSTDAPSSQHSNERTTCSSARSTSTAIDATASTPTARAPVSTTRASAVSAAKSSGGAKSTVASEPQATLPMLTARKHTADSMLTLPRPTRRGDCGQEARPCPWVGCRHHLLLEVAQAKERTGQDMRPTSLRMNRANRGRTTMGRRPGLESSAAHLVVQRWIDDATEQLSSMMHTCSLDVVDQYPDGLSEGSVALLLGVTHQAVNAETRIALRKFKAGMRDAMLESEDL